MNGLNYAFNDKIEDSFYYIRTRIKLFDDMQIADSLKQKIFLIDFPGFGTGNIFEKKNIYNKVLSICHLFVFVVRNSVIKENSFKSKLKDIFDKAQIEKKKLISQFIKSCLFILNNDIDQSTSEDDLKKVKENIQEMLHFKLDDINDMKLCFFNAKYYDNFCSNYNYFYDINNLFKREFDDYTKKKYSLFKNPFSFNISKNNEFLDFFYNNIKEKIKNLYDIKNLNKLLKKQETNENIQKSIKDNLIEMVKNEKISNKNISEIEEKLLKIISFGQNKLPELKTLKESNIVKFKEILNFQINFINDIKQKDLGNKSDNVISMLDMFFRRNFKERKKDLKEIDNLCHKIGETSILIMEIGGYYETFIKEIKESYKNNIKKSLISNKEKLEEKLKSKSYDFILKEINIEISKNLKGLNNRIREYINFNEGQTEILDNLRVDIIKKYSLGKKYLTKDKKNFSSYMAEKLGNGQKDFEKQLLEELKYSCESSTDILFKKGIKEWFNSLFSDLNYLENIIDILIDTSLIKINSIFDIIKEESIDYLNSLFNKIILLFEAATLEFDEEQKKKWTEFCNLYESKRENIINIKNQILNIIDEKNKENLKVVIENKDNNLEEFEIIF